MTAVQEDSPMAAVSQEVAEIPHTPAHEGENESARLPTLLGSRQASSEQQYDSKTNVESIAAVESDSMSHDSRREIRRSGSSIAHRLREIQKEMQEATRGHDARAIQVLMAERSTLLEEQQQQRRVHQDVPSQEQNVTSEGPLHRLSSRLAGFGERRTARVSVAELMAEGLTRSEASAEVVARNRNAMLMQVFEGWIRCFTLSYIFLTVLLTGLLFCHILAYVVHFNYGSPPCQGALKHFTNVVLGVSSVEMLVWICSSRKDRWLEDTDPDAAVLHQKHPHHGCLWSFAFVVVVGNMAVLYALVLHHVKAAHPEDPFQALPSCQTATPFLYYSTVAHAIGLLVYSVFLVINFFGLSRVLEKLMQRGLLRSKLGTLEGAMENNTIRVTQIDENDCKCSICMETLTVENACQTKYCHHTFHTKCLKHWLMVHRTCPLCRENLEFEHPV